MRHPCDRDHLPDRARTELTRRWFFRAVRRRPGRHRAGAIAGPGRPRPPRPTRWPPRQPHFAPKAKRVIFLFMAGAPSHLELFDYKPELAKFDGKLPPAELLKGYRAAFINPELDAARAQVQVRQARPVAAPSFPSCCRTWPRSSTTSPS